MGNLQQLKSEVHMPRFESPAARNLQLLSRNGMRIDCYFSCIGILAQHQALAPITAELPTLRNCSRPTYAFEHDVSPVGPCFFRHAPFSLRRIREFLYRDSRLCTELFSQ